jgi:branched-chain amino acid transport system substrate-binding protein
MIKNKLLIVVASICLALILAMVPFLTACPKAGPEEPIKIGALLPLTGPFAMWGSWFDRSLRFTLDEANWEVAGRPIQLIVEDEGGTDPTVAMEKLRKLVEVDKIDVLTGPFYGASRPVCWAYASSVPIVTVDVIPAERPEMEYDYTFYGAQAYIDENYTLGKYAYDKMGIRTVTTIAWDYQCPWDFIEGFTDGFQEEGGTVVQQQWTEIGAADYTPYLSALKEADAVATACCGGDNEMKVLIQANELGIRQKMKGWFTCGTAELESPQLLSQLGDLGLGAMYSGPYCASIDTQANKDFVAKFEAKFGEAPSCWDEMRYEVIHIILAGLEATKGDTDPAKLKAAIQGLKLEFPSGSFSFDEGRVAVRDRYLVQIEKVGGEYVGVIVQKDNQFHTRAPIYPFP